MIFSVLANFTVQAVCFEPKLLFDTGRPLGARLHPATTLPDREQIMFSDPGSIIQEADLQPQLLPGRGPFTFRSVLRVTWPLRRPVWFAFEFKKSWGSKEERQLLLVLLVESLVVMAVLMLLAGVEHSMCRICRCNSRHKEK